MKRPSLVAVCLSTLWICGCRDESNKPPPDVSATSSARSAASAVVTSTPSVSPAVAAASSSKPEPYVFKASSRPTVREWCDAQGIRRGSEEQQPGEYTKFPEYISVVREWVAIGCPELSADGKRVGVRSKGLMTQLEDPTRAGFEQGYAVFLAQLKPGQSMAVECDYSTVDNQGYDHRKTSKIDVSWPAGDPPDGRMYNGSLQFTNVLGNGCTHDAGQMCDFRRRCLPYAEADDERAKTEAADLAAAKAAAKAAQSASAAAPTNAPALSSATIEAQKSAPVAANGVALVGQAEPDVPGLVLPKDDEWAAALEVTAPGSSAAGCETKALNGWFRMRCKAEGGYTSALVEQGRRATQTKVTIENGVLTLVTAYVQGTDFRMRMTRPGKTFLFNLAWPPGTRPLEVARITPVAQ